MCETASLLKPFVSAKHFLVKVFSSFSSKTKRSEWSRQQVTEILRPLEPSHEDYMKVMKLFEADMDRGLGKATNPSAIVKMFPSYVRSIPDGSESGRFLALDLGGTNFRVLLITLHEGRDPEIKSKVYHIPERVMSGPGNELFDHIVNSIAWFLEDEHVTQDPAHPIPVGFTFSFPCKQRALDVGILEMWTKGFNCEGVVGENVGQLLHEAVERRKESDVPQKLYVECVAVLNDTVGTLMSCAYQEQQCLIGLILGTGTNACYMEQLDRVELWDGDTAEPKQVIINTEWGAFGSDGALDFLRTEHDRFVDGNSINAGKQIYEKMISGMYLGEIVRLVLVRLIKEKHLFGGHLPAPLNTEGKFFTKFVSEIETDKGVTYKNTKSVLDELGVHDAGLEDCELVRTVCQVVSRRAANLAAAGLATLINRIDREDVTIGVDGSLYKYHPNFKAMMEEKISQLIRPGLKFQLMESTDGSGKGAALVAAVAQRMRQSEQASSLRELVQQATA